MTSSDAQHQILLIEDDSDVRSALSDLLTDEGYGLRAVTNGEEGVAALGSGIQPDLIISDLRMPRMDGLQFIAHRNSDPRTAKIPVILLTAANEAVSGGDDVTVLKKPIDVELFLNAVIRLLKKH